MRKLILTVSLCIAFVVAAEACLNYYYTADRDGHLHYQGDDDGIMIGFNKNFNTRMISQKIIKLEKKLREERSYMLLSDYALMLMKLGRNAEALQILKTLYFAYPDEYQLASNLGTSYELAGEVDSALKYIRRGMELNPLEHEGSEWVHVKILETKKKLAADPDYLDSHTVLELTTEQEYDTLVGRQVELQVRERFPFCPGPDRIMASLMLDLGDVTLNTNSIEDAKTYYNIAKYYFGDSSAMVEDKIAEAIRLLGKHSAVRPDPRVPGRREATNVRLGPYAYTQMLDDNDPDGFKADWSQINTNVDSLLALVNLQMTVQEAQEMRESNPGPEPGSPEAPGTHVPADKTGLWIIGVLFLVLVGGYAFMLRRNG